MKGCTIVKFLRLHEATFNAGGSLKLKSIVIINAARISVILPYKGYSYEYAPLSEYVEKLGDLDLHATTDYPSLIIVDGREYVVFESPSYLTSILNE